MPDAASSVRAPGQPACSRDLARRCARRIRVDLAARAGKGAMTITRRCDACVETVLMVVEPKLTSDGSGVGRQPLDIAAGDGIEIEAGIAARDERGDKAGAPRRRRPRSGAAWSAPARGRGA